MTLPSDILLETGEALSANKARSSLTILGIVIGIASVISMVAIGQGAQNAVTSSIQSLGANLIQVMPGATRGVGFTVNQGRGSAKTLTNDDVDAILQNVPYVAAISAELSGRYQVTAPGTNTNTQIIGATVAYPTVRNVSVAEGVFISDNHLYSFAKVAVLGPTARDDLFGEGADAIGKTIRINRIQFTVIGVTTEKGGSGFTNQDDSIFIPLTTTQRYLVGDTYLTSINVQAQNADVMSTVQEGITAVLLDTHGIVDAALADFSTLNQEDIVSAASGVTETFTLLLGAVAGISLLVGGIGIMNMMLTTVTERTREVGLRKALGARPGDISAQFLTEAVVLTFAGGVLGVLIGFLVSFIVSVAGVIDAEVTLSSVFLAFGVSAAIGVVFGYYPARRAARMDPIVALRYE